MILRRWNYEKHIYEPYQASENAATYMEDLDSFVDCAECGKKIRFGCSYTSLRIHTPIFGMGYAVCEECYKKEWEERRKYCYD